VKSPATKLRVLQALCLLPLPVLAGVFFLSPPFQEGVSEAFNLLRSGDLSGLESWAGATGGWAPLIMAGLMVLQAISPIPIPALLVTITNSFLFGPLLGGLLSILSANIAAMVCFSIGRLFGEQIVERLVSEKTKARIDHLAGTHGTSAVFVARLVPIVPFDGVSYLCGIGRVRAAPFFFATLLGQAPAAMTYSFLAQEAAAGLKGDRDPWLVTLTIALSVLGLLCLSWWVRGILLGRGEVGEADGDEEREGGSSQS
tara:strand:- start:15 stop:785 length:771 start_codon:yes stop_codon:yes gene_type:complete